jgi:hypothetical protein
MYIVVAILSGVEALLLLAAAREDSKKKVPI